jgi:hypothetical protein
MRAEAVLGVMEYEGSNTTPGYRWPRINNE